MNAKPLLGLLLLLTAGGPAGVIGAEQLFVLHDGELRHLRFEKGAATLTKTYTPADLPNILPADRLEMKSGNVLCVYDAAFNLKARFLYDPVNDRLEAYTRERAAQSLETPDLTEKFRDDTSLYSRTARGSYRNALRVEEARRAFPGAYRDFFVLEDELFGVASDHIDRLRPGDAGGAAATELALSLPGAGLGRVAVSPWGEAFISDAATRSIRRVSMRRAGLTASDSVADPRLVAPGGLGFNLDGDLFVTTGGASGVLRFGFVLDNFVTWRAVPKEVLDSGASSARDLALARPVGFVISEKTDPLVKLNTTGHFGISQATFLSPKKNSESAVIALVEYEAGGYTPVHLHPQMEQVEIVLAGRALWEVGEFEREVGPGDVIFCPRNVKHGYKVLGDKPFKFLQVEWRDLPKSP